MDSFRERMYTLHGFGISSPTEEECVQWIMEQLAQDKENIMSYVVARLTFSEQLEDDPDGEFREGEELEEGINLKWLRFWVLRDHSSLTPLLNMIWSKSSQTVNRIFQTYTNSRRS